MATGSISQVTNAENRSWIFRFERDGSDTVCTGPRPIALVLVRRPEDHSPVCRTQLDSKHKGARSELIACAWLLEQGYEVFRNISDRGIIDIIAIKGDEQLKIDVKSKRHGSSLTKHQNAIGVMVLAVDANGECTIIPPKPQRDQSRICMVCGRPFRGRFGSQMCSEKCRYEARRDKLNGSDENRQVS
jgi:Holliday junction resolvase